MVVVLESQTTGIVQLTSQILLEFEKQKWEDDFLGWASRDERKSNTLAHKIIKCLRLGDIQPIAKTAQEMSVINDERWKKFTRNISKLIEKLGQDCQ